MLDVLFINSAEQIALKNEVNGTMLLATKLIQSGFSADVLRFAQIKSYQKDYSQFIQDIAAEILRRAPRCVSFYTLWPYYHIMLRIASELKSAQPDIVTVFGGPQASATAEATLSAMKAVDYICTGEGENTVVPFFTALLRSNCSGLSAIPGLYYRSQGQIVSNTHDVPLCDLNELPRWDPALCLPLSAEPEAARRSRNYFMPLDVGRGCPFQCTFCCSSRFWKRAYRLKSAERILEDLRYYYDNYGIRSFSFSHDAFTVNQKLVHDICDRIISDGLDITFKCTTRVDCVTEELILKMKQAGLSHIELGIETGSPRMQKIIRKNLDLSRVQHLVAFLKQQKIHVALFFMYGFPEETEADLAATLDLFFRMVDMGVEYTSMSFCKFNPSTVITQQYADELVFDPAVDISSRNVFGFWDEREQIASHRDIFPFFFHLSTPVRNQYQYLSIFTHLYRQYPISAPMIRSLYRGDHLKFYRDFLSANSGVFQQDMGNIMKHIKQDQLSLFLNTLSLFPEPYIKQLKSIMQFEDDCHTVSRAKESCTIQRQYDFSIVEYQLKLPIEQYSDLQSELLIYSSNGKPRIKVLSNGIR